MTKQGLAAFVTKDWNMMRCTVIILLYYHLVQQNKSSQRSAWGKCETHRHLEWSCFNIVTDM